MKNRVAPESPVLIRHNDTFYLFVCGFDGLWDGKTVQGAYQHLTRVYQSDNPLEFAEEVAELRSHAPEVFQDKQGQWFISSAEWPQRGVSIARLEWR
jgi:beta-fructofuranosidase